MLYRTESDDATPKRNCAAFPLSGYQKREMHAASDACEMLLDLLSAGLLERPPLQNDFMKLISFD
jgi:hypothetical protein